MLGEIRWSKFPQSGLRFVWDIGGYWLGKLRYWLFEILEVLRQVEILDRQVEILALWDIGSFEASWDIGQASWDIGTLRYGFEILECFEILVWDITHIWDITYFEIQLTLRYNSLLPWSFNDHADIDFWDIGIVWDIGLLWDISLRYWLGLRYWLEILVEASWDIGEASWDIGFLRYWRLQGKLRYW